MLWVEQIAFSFYSWQWTSKQGLIISGTINDNWHKVLGISHNGSKSSVSWGPAWGFTRTFLCFYGSVHWITGKWPVASTMACQGQDI